MAVSHIRLLIETTEWPTAAFINSVSACSKRTGLAQWLLPPTFVFDGSIPTGIEPRALSGVFVYIFIFFLVLSFIFVKYSHKHHTR